MPSPIEQKRTISWVDNDYAVLAPTFYILERQGFELVSYSTYYEAWENRVKIGETNLLILELVLPPGRRSSYEVSRIDERQRGVHLLRSLRTEGIQLPAVFWSDRYLADKSILEEMNATYLTKPIRPSDFRKHIFERLNMPLVG